MFVSAANPIGARPGDRIVLAIDTSSLLKASFLIYVFPILVMMVGAVVGLNLGKIFSVNPSAAAAVCAVPAFLVAIVYMQRKGNRLARRRSYQPRITRIVQRQALTPAQAAELMDISDSSD